VPELVAEALTNDETAERRDRSLATANTHASRILLKLHARGRAQLVAITHENGLVKPRPARHEQRTRCSQPIRTKRPGERPPDARSGRSGVADRLASATGREFDSVDARR
jgi:hypothetical protein